MHTATSQQQYLQLKRQADFKIQELAEKPVVYIGAASCGLAAGAGKVKEVFLREINNRGLDVEVREAGCIGHCYCEPLVIISKPGFPALAYGSVNEEVVMRLAHDFLVKDDPCYELAIASLEPNEFFPAFSDLSRGQYEEKIILKNCGIIVPLDIDSYISKDGYAALARALTYSPDEIIEEIKKSSLRGRGGAGFSAGIKWETCRSTPADTRYVICNADEGDPGAFMDRSLLESNPHQVLEGMIISAYAVGASRGYLYIRAEYPLAVSRVREALKKAREKGLLGESILGSGFSFELEIFEGAGAFVCGEATALVRSIEGRAGIPRVRPPSLAASGLWGKPTLLNNVKTLAYVPGIISQGADWFKSIGTAESSGTAVFSLVGKVVQGGLVEVPMGTTLRTLIFDIGKGVPDGRKFKAVQIGGPSGGCLPESVLDIPVDFESLDKAGSIMGSGGLVVMDEEDCMVTIARYFLEFTQAESCGKCTFCRLGTRHMLNILNKITRGEGTLDDLQQLEELAEDVKLGSLCNLGKDAPNPVISTLRYFRDEYLAHIEEGRCPAGKCRDLVAYYISPYRCCKPCMSCVSICSLQRPICSNSPAECNACVDSCPTDAIYTRPDGLKAIEQDKCIKCDECRRACPEEYDAVVKLSPPGKLPKYQATVSRQPASSTDN